MKSVFSIMLFLIGCVQSDDPKLINFIWFLPEQHIFRIIILNDQNFKVHSQILDVLLSTQETSWLALYNKLLHFVFFFSANATRNNKGKRILLNDIPELFVLQMIEGSKEGRSEKLQKSHVVTNEIVPSNLGSSISFELRICVFLFSELISRRIQ